jgi:nucleoside phosphorylase
MKIHSFQRADIVVLTVIPPELRAIREALEMSDHDRIKDDNGTIYDRCSIFSNSQKREYRVALGCIAESGNPGAAVATIAAIQRWQPQAVLLMGIAAGIRKKVKIGQVVFSERVVGYESAAWKIDEDKFSYEEPRPEIERWSHSIAQDVSSYLADLNNEQLTERFLFMDGAFPQASETEQDSIVKSIEVTTSTIASGEKLLRDPSRLERIHCIHGKTEVGEMEALGFVQACRRERVDWLVVRGISDFGDQFKSDKFHRLATMAASTVLVDFLHHGLNLRDPQEYQKDEVNKSDSMNTIGKSDPINRARDLLSYLLDSQFDDVVIRYVNDRDKIYINLKETRAQIINSLIAYGIQKEGDCLPRLLETIYRVAPALMRVK